MPIWKQFLILCLVAGAAFAGYEGYRMFLAPQPSVTQAARGERPVTVEVAMAERRIMRRTVEAVGTTRAVQSIDIVPETDGRLVELTIAPGVHVTKGDVLARLDDTIERADLAEAEAGLVEQRQTLERTRILRTTNAVSQAAEEDAVARLAEAVASVERARRRLSDRVITAPFDGIVGLTNYTIGARVTEGQILTRLDDLSEVEVEFSLPETVFAQVRPGQTILARSAAFPDRNFTGTIDVVDTRIDPVSRAFRTRAVIPNPDSTLPAGMFLSLTLVLEEKEQITIPEEALIFQAAETFVYVPQDGKASRRTVTSGQRKDGHVAILSGLEAGEEVVIRGMQRLRDGSGLNILGADRDATAASSDQPPESAS